MNYAGVALLPQAHVPHKRLGRHVHHDPRSCSFPAHRASRIVDVRHDVPGLPLDQREQDCCTAHALCGALSFVDHSVAREQPLETLVAILHQAAGALEEADTPYAGFGHSALTVCRAAMRLGLITRYAHAFGVEHALQALVLSPVMTGFTWYSSFDFPDPETGLVEITPDASVRGGHEVLADEIDIDDQLVWFYNSWGAEFGRGGRFCMSFATWDYLLRDRGDVTVPVAA